MYLLPELRAIILDFGRQRTLKEIHLDICFYLYEVIKPSSDINVNQDEIIQQLELTPQENNVNNLSELNLTITFWKYVKEIYYRIHVPFTDHLHEQINSEDCLEKDVLDEFFKIMELHVCSDFSE